MNVENYLMITLAYGAGVYTAYRLGVRHGVAVAVKETVKTIAEMSGKSVPALLDAMVKHVKGKNHAAI